MKETRFQRGLVTYIIAYEYSGLLWEHMKSEQWKVKSESTWRGDMTASEESKLLNGMVIFHIFVWNICVCIEVLGSISGGGIMLPFIFDFLLPWIVFRPLYLPYHNQENKQ